MSQDSNDNPNVQVPAPTFGVGRIVVAIASVLAFISFFLPWIDFMMFKQHAFAITKTVADRSMLGAIIWHGPIFLAFLHPAWLMLTKKEIGRADRLRGFVSAAIGFVWAIIFMNQAQSGIAQGMPVSVNIIGTGVYLYLCACVILIVGLALYDRQAPKT